MEAEMQRPTDDADETLVECQALTISGANFVFGLRLDHFWQITLSYQEGAEVIVASVGIESSYSTAMRWISNVLRTGDDTDFVDRANGIVSILPRELQPQYRYLRQLQEHTAQQRVSGGIWETQPMENTND